MSQTANNTNNGTKSFLVTNNIDSDNSNLSWAKPRGKAQKRKQMFCLFSVKSKCFIVCYQKILFHCWCCLPLTHPASPATNTVTLLLHLLCLFSCTLLVRSCYYVNHLSANDETTTDVLKRSVRICSLTFWLFSLYWDYSNVAWLVYIEITQTQIKGIRA